MRGKRSAPVFYVLPSWPEPGPCGPGTHLREGLLRLFFRPRLRARLPLVLRVSSQSPRPPLLPPLLSGPPHSGPASDTHWFRGAVPRPPSCYRWQEVRVTRTGTPILKKAKWQDSFVCQRGANMDQRSPPHPCGTLGAEWKGS